MMFEVKLIKRDTVDWNSVPTAEYYNNYSKSFYKYDKEHGYMVWCTADSLRRFNQNNDQHGVWHTDITNSDHDIQNLKNWQHKNTSCLKGISVDLLNAFFYSDHVVNEDDLFEYCGYHHGGLIVKEKVNGLYFEFRMVSAGKNSNVTMYDNVVYEVRRKMIPTYVYHREENE